MSGPTESLRWNACVHSLDLGYTLNRNRFVEWSQNLVNSKGKIPSTGGSAEGRIREAASLRTASPTHYRLSFSGPCHGFKTSFYFAVQSSFQFLPKMASGKGPYALFPVSQRSPQGRPRNSVNDRSVEHRSFTTPEDGVSAASFLHSSFLRVINAVMLWPVHVQKVPLASQHICPAKLQTLCDFCTACQPFYLFFSP